MLPRDKSVKLPATRGKISGLRGLSRVLREFRISRNRGKKGVTRAESRLLRFDRLAWTATFDAKASADPQQHKVGPPPHSHGAND